MADKFDIASILAVIAVAYPNFAVTEQTTEVYLQILSDIPADELKAATLHCISESGRKFAPSVGELRGAVAELRGMSANLPSSFEAWQEVGKQISINGGDFGNPVWSHPIVQKAVEAIGWRNLRMSEDATADRARFIQCYEQFQQRAQNENLLLPEVRGYIESNGGRFLAPLDQMKQLADRMKK
jgi:hypothetical protein